LAGTEATLSPSRELFAPSSPAREDSLSKGLERISQLEAAVVMSPRADGKVIGEGILEEAQLETRVKFDIGDEKVEGPVEGPAVDETMKGAERVEEETKTTPRGLSHEDSREEDDYDAEAEEKPIDKSPGRVETGWDIGSECKSQTAAS
jgi:hypothetical protein